MKKFLLLLLLFAGILVNAQNNDGWDDWQKTSCYSKVLYRMKIVKQHGEQYLWKLQFKNEYNEVISFNYHVTDKLQEYNITTHRKTMNAKQLSDDIDFYTKEKDIFLLVDKLSFSPYPNDYQECEN